MTKSLSISRKKASAKIIAEFDKIFARTSPIKQPTTINRADIEQSHKWHPGRFPEVFGEFSPRWLGLKQAFGRKNNIRNVEHFVFGLGWRSDMWEYFPVPTEGSFFYNLATYWDDFIKHPPRRFSTSAQTRQPKSSDMRKAQRALQKQCSLDPIGFYSPAHFGSAPEYGIHLSQGGLANAAYEIHSLCPKENRNVVLVTACHFAYCHLVTHAWIEDICSMLDFHYGCADKIDNRNYVRAHQAGRCLLSQEESICDTAAFGMLHRFLEQPDAEIRKSREIPPYNGKRIFEAIVKWRTLNSNSKPGFVPIRQMPHESPEFVRGMARLLHDTFKYKGMDVGAVLSTFLGCYLRSGEEYMPDIPRGYVQPGSALNMSDRYPVIVRLE